jgi:RNA polymerase sigma-70 factor, ECF subfamily
MPEQPAIETFRPYLIAIARMQLTARPWLASKMDASDLVQQVLLKGHDSRQEYRGQSSGEMACWLRQILHRTLANELRSFGQEKRDIGAERSIEADLEASSQRLDAWLAADQTSPSQAVSQAERAIQLARSIASLPSDQREVILLKHLHGLSLSEIATRLEKTPAAIAGLLRRGLEQLRETLAEDAPL